MQFFYWGRKCEHFGKLVAGLLLMTLLLCTIQFIAARIEEETTPAVAFYEKVVALTFDDGPNPRTTPKLLDGLKERNVQATFFLIGEKAKENPKVVLQMQQDGHIIGNHTYSHVQLDAVELASAVAEVNKTNEIIQEITGMSPEYIRPPYGVWNNQVAENISMTPVLWTVDPFDWNVRDSKRVVDSVLKEVKSGDIILLHDIYETSVVAALEIVDQLKKQGYVFVTVDDLMIE